MCQPKKSQSIRNKLKIMKEKKLENDESIKYYTTIHIILILILINMCCDSSKE